MFQESLNEVSFAIMLHKSYRSYPSRRRACFWRRPLIFVGFRWNNVMVIPSTKSQPPASPRRNFYICDSHHASQQVNKARVGVKYMVFIWLSFIPNLSLKVCDGWWLWAGMGGGPLSSTRDSFTIMFEDMYTPCLNTCAHPVWIHV